MILTENPPVSLTNFAGLKTQFDWVWDGYNRVTVRERIPIRAEIADSAVVDDLFLIHPNRQISNNDALAEISRQELVPCTLEELLVYARRHPERQLEILVMALGEVLVIGGNRRVPYLRGFGTSRRLDAYSLARGLPRHHRFLARRVRK